jgi:Protein of unknown function (DUF3489)
MTNAKTTSRATDAEQTKTDASTAEAKTKTKRPRGKAATASAAGTGLAETTTSATNALSHPKPPRQTKAALLRTRLAEAGGVSLAALIEATGWQAHTLRAAMSGLRKEGLTLARRREGEDTIYAIAPGGTEASGAEEDCAPGVPPAAADTTPAIESN